MVLGANYLDAPESMDHVACTLDTRGEYEKAEAMHRENLAKTEKSLGLKHPKTLSSMHNLALVLVNQGKYQEAEQMHRQCGITL